MFLSETFDVRSRNENNNEIVSRLSGWSVQWLEGHLNVVFGGEHDVVKCNCSQRAREEMLPATDAKPGKRYF